MTDDPKKILSVFDAIAIIAGVVIGAGIFRLPSLVAAEIGSEWIVLGAWLLGGLISLAGALCFAELMSAYPSPGGEYHVLSRAYGARCGFMFAWARMTVIQTGSIALLAFVFGDYAAELAPLGRHGPAAYAALAVISLTIINILGVRQTKKAQNLLFIAALAGMVSVIAAGLTGLAAGEPSPAPPRPGGEDGLGASAMGTAMILVLLTYGGWNESAYISAEMRSDRHGMAWALGIAIFLITLIYVAVNAVYLRMLGPEGMAASQAVAHDVVGAVFGAGGATLVSILILVVVLGSANGTILTGARTNFALGRDFPLFRYLGHWDGRGGGAPVRALLVQGTIALALVVLGAASRGGIETMVEYLAPVFWLFFLLIGISLFVLRRREPGTTRPFRVPLYPVTPALFCLTSAALLYSSITYTGAGALAGVAVLAMGLPLLPFARTETVKPPTRYGLPTVRESAHQTRGTEQ